MARRDLSSALVRLAGGARGAASDAALLARFAAARDEEAFAELIRRHGAMVTGVCNRVLRDGPDAEDAFQATFLLLALNPGAPAESVAGWLHGVARRTALNARKARMRRRKHERATVPDPVTASPASLEEVRAVLDDELARLADPYRTAFVLCCLEGHTRPEAAAALGCTEGTVSSRLARARRALRDRLTRRGIGLPAALAAVALTEAAAPAGVSAGLVDATARLAVLIAAAGRVTDAVPPAAAALLKGVTPVALKKTFTLVGLVAAAALAVGGVADSTRPAPPGSRPPDRTPAVPALKDGMPADAAPAGQPRPLTREKLSGTWTGEKNGVKVVVDFRHRSAAVSEAQWIVEFLAVDTPTRQRQGRGCATTTMRTDAAAGAVYLDFVSAAGPPATPLGRVDQDAAGGLFLTVLPAAEARDARSYRAVERVPLTRVDDDAKQIQGTWRVVEMHQNRARPTKAETDAVKAAALDLRISATRIVMSVDKSEMGYHIEWWPAWAARTKDGVRPPRGISFRVGDADAAGIYELKDDDLKICMGRKPMGGEPPVAPLGFNITAAPAGEFPTLFVLKRVPAAGPAATVAPPVFYALRKLEVVGRTLAVSLYGTEPVAENLPVARDVRVWFRVGPGPGRVEGGLAELGVPGTPLTLEFGPDAKMVTGITAHLSPTPVLLTDVDGQAGRLTGVSLGHDVAHRGLRVRADAAVTIDGEKAALTDLRAGMVVDLEPGPEPLTPDTARKTTSRLTLDKYAPFSRIEAHRQAVEGTVARVDAAAGTLTLAAAGTPLLLGPLPVAPDAGVLLGGRPGRLADLRPGARVTVELRGTDTTPRERRIVAVAAEQPAGPEKTGAAVTDPRDAIVALEKMHAAFGRDKDGLVTSVRLHPQGESLADALPHLRRLPRLASLALYTNHLTPDGFLALAELSPLAEVEVHAPRVEPGPRSGGWLAAPCPRLPWDKLPRVRTIRLSGAGVGDDQLQDAATSPSVRSLFLGQVVVSAKGLARLRDAKVLDMLCVQSSPVTPDGVRAIAGVPNLKSLTLTASPLGADGFRPLAGMTGLEYLNLESTKATDADVAHLASLAKLSHLDLGYNPDVTDAALGHLTGLSRLTGLRLYETKVTDEGVTRLKGMRPDLIVGK